MKQRRSPTMRHARRGRGRQLSVVLAHRRVLDGLTFRVPAGRVTGLLGPSGSGKTTLMRCLVGVQRIDSGELTVLRRPAGTAELRHRIGYVTQAASVYNDLSARANVRYFAAIHGTTEAAADRALSDVALAVLADRRVGTLSGGERARCRWPAHRSPPRPARPRRADELLFDIGVVVATTVVALTLAAATLRRRTGAMTRRTRRVLVITALAAATAIGLAAGADMVTASRYVRTDNAQVDGDHTLIVAPVTGTLVRWDVTLGTRVGEEQTLGRIELPGGFAQPQQPIAAPAAGDVVRNNVTEGTFVTVGTQLAVAYDLSAVHVTARVDETDIDAVHVGQQVDVRGGRLSGLAARRACRRHPHGRRGCAGRRARR